MQERLRWTTRTRRSRLKVRAQGNGQQPKHLLSNSHQRRSVYDDSCFTVLCRARRFCELKVLEAVFIRKHNPNLYIPKGNVKKPRL